MKYGTTKNGNLILAPRKLEGEDVVIYNPTPEQLSAAGYKPVVYTDTPEAPEGYYAEAYWEEQDGEIIEVWAFVPNPEPTEEDALTRYTNELTGEDDPDLVSATESLITKFTEE